MLTPLGESVVSVRFLLAATILIAGVVYLGVLMRSGTISTRSRYAEVDCIPWGYVTATALLCGACLVRGIAGAAAHVSTKLSIFRIFASSGAVHAGAQFVYFGYTF